MSLRMKFAGAVLMLGVVLPVRAANEQVIPLEIDVDHVTAWNRFADQTLALHKRQTAGRSIKKSTVTDQYYGTAARGYAYTETSYHDASTGLLLSRVRVDRDKPEILHIVEVYIYDEKGRVTRDFAAIYLPWSQNAPMRTMINLHGYNHELHAYRQFNASGERIYEQCKGKLSGATVDLSLEDYEIRPATTSSDVYQKCFAGVPNKVGAYLSPH